MAPRKKAAGEKTITEETAAGATAPLAPTTKVTKITKVARKKAAGKKEAVPGAVVPIKKTRTRRVPDIDPSGKALIVVESPAKAKTINKYLGKDYVVEASVGHIKNLPKSKMGIDVEGGFTPEYETIAGKEVVIERLRDHARKATSVYLATDPDREGEAIAWHIAKEIDDDNTERLPRDVPRNHRARHHRRDEAPDEGWTRTWSTRSRRGA